MFWVSEGGLKNLFFLCHTDSLLKNKVAKKTEPERDLRKMNFIKMLLNETRC